MVAKIRAFCCHNGENDILTHVRNLSPTVVYFFWKKLLSLTINIEKGGLKYLTKRTEEPVKHMKQTISIETIRTDFDANFLKMRTKKIFVAHLLPLIRQITIAHQGSIY